LTSLALFVSLSLCDKTISGRRPAERTYGAHAWLAPKT